MNPLISSIDANTTRHIRRSQRRTTGNLFVRKTLRTFGSLPKLLNRNDPKV